MGRALAVLALVAQLIAPDIRRLFLNRNQFDITRDDA